MVARKDKKLKSISYYRKRHQAIPEAVYEKEEKGTASKTLHDAWGSPYVVHKYNYAPWGHPPSGKKRTGKYTELKETLTEKGKRAGSRKARPSNKASSGASKKKSAYSIVYGLIGKLDKGNGAYKGDIDTAARKMGISAKEIEDIYDKLMNKGLAYEPNARTIRRIDKIGTPKKGSNSKKGSSGRASRFDEEFAYRRALESYEIEEAERNMVYSDRRSVKADLEDMGYSDTRKTWRRTGARTQYIARNKLALREMKDRGLY